MYIDIDTYVCIDRDRCICIYLILYIYMNIYIHIYTYIYIRQCPARVDARRAARSRSCRDMSLIRDPGRRILASGLVWLRFFSLCVESLSVSDAASAVLDG